MGRHASIDDRALLAILEDIGRPASAYEVMDAFPAEKRPKPPAAYRALDRLIARGLVHRVESLKAYMACPQPGHKTAAVLAICNRCGSVEELEDRRLGPMLESWEEGIGFTSDTCVFELRGLCRGCTAGAASAD